MGTTPYAASQIRLRHNFGKIKVDIKIPNLINLQRDSYKNFLQSDCDSDKRLDQGLHGVFKSVFPVVDFNKSIQLEYLGYRLEPPKYDVEECLQRGMNYSSSLKVSFRLVIFDISERINKNSEEPKIVKDVREQEVYMGEIPLMTKNASFVINGIERVVVSQLHRSPGIFFEHDNGKGSVIGKLLHSARMIPYRGSWLDFEFDQKNILYASIDRRRKFPATILLKALGYDDQSLLNYYYKSDILKPQKDGTYKYALDINALLGQRAGADILDKEGNVIVGRGRRITRATVKKVEQAKIKELKMDKEDLIGVTLSEPILNLETGEIIADVNTDLTEEILNAIAELKLKAFAVIFFDKFSVGNHLRNTLLLDKVATKEEAILELYRRQRPGDPADLESATKFLNRLFFDESTYNLGKVGRLKINHRIESLVTPPPLDHHVLTNDDILSTVKILLNIKDGKGDVDDIDHLGNRRVRAVGELLENQYRLGLVRMEKSIREKVGFQQDLEAVMPYDLVNSSAINSVIKEFFGLGQLSQFMDQINPLSEVTHKRRLSALGPGGLSRDRAGFEVRDVHHTHYGRICPIETPEGPNIGLISALATYAKVNEYGFIETPFRRVNDGVINDDIIYMSALDEKDKRISQINREGNKVKDDKLTIRRMGEYETVAKEEVELMDVSPGQLISVATALIPFLEHDDANRALMGANMQRQAVPMIKSAAPLVGTGMEKFIARDSGTSVVCSNQGTVVEVEANRIVVRRSAKKGAMGANIDIYNLVKYRKTNQNTCFNQTAVVRVGDLVNKGDVIADGPATELGELALGQNMLVAFTPWMGYNFEDSVLISERLVKQDVYTSIHIEAFECLARDTKLGAEEITRDIANISDSDLVDIDNNGVIRIGAEVAPSSILVGKVTPKGETQLSPEEKLLRAIFGDKAGDFRDSSLRVPSGVVGTVIDVQIYNRDGVGDDDRHKAIVESKQEKIAKDLLTEENMIKNAALEGIKDLLVGQKSSDQFLNEDGSVELLKKGQVIGADDLEAIPFEFLSYIPVTPALEQQVTQIVTAVRSKLKAVKVIFGDKADRLSRGDELAPGVIKVVKVYVAIKRRIQVGDKLAGRHGNKVVVSRILPEADMPYLADGRPVDMVLNPLGVPSRMNIGQILETHLGWAAYDLGHQLEAMLEEFDAKQMRDKLNKIYQNKDLQEKINTADDASLKGIAKQARNGVHIATPVFDGANETNIQNLLDLAGLPKTGQTTLFDGRTGEAFHNDITIGIMYVLKLNHLVEEKIHARSIGPYSLVSQQPLSGKAQFGGQRLGEMEVWAMEAYGAAYSLQEFLTVKSDDVAGRTRIYESIVKGENVLEPGLPESFNVLIRELQSLALDINLVKSDILTEDEKAEIVEEKGFNN